MEHEMTSRINTSATYNFFVSSLTAEFVKNHIEDSRPCDSSTILEVENNRAVPASSN